MSFTHMHYFHSMPETCKYKLNSVAALLGVSVAIGWLVIQPSHAQTFRSMAQSPPLPVSGAAVVAGQPGAVTVRTVPRAVRNGLAGAQEALARDELSAALALYDKVLAIEPENSFALSSRAAVLQKMGRFDSARGDLERALAAGADRAVAEASLALVTASQDIRSVDESLNLARRFGGAPGHAAVAGQIHALRGDYAAAEELLRRAVRVTPDHPTVLWNYAVVLDHLGRGPDAVRYYLRAQQTMPVPTTADQVLAQRTLQARLAWLDPSYRVPAVRQPVTAEPLAPMPVQRVPSKADACVSLSMPFGAFSGADCRPSATR
ncbi:MAG: hypothetical protein B7X59_00495 [Polaromonas sp. 39-63-203]|jgi:Flp pilus assembly protein TadD|uniref:tetratricopeptide repeat protein n=1 Tax=Polaromonas sp. TaxID=1869339 RepID=UPI000BC42780|nr:tetratricopeptide repeat protein [Polaromonas sp.]OYY53710.1 MAG: hypothetical protein B7Y54_01830 [Polaromonas sp. 35-63-240]OYZ03417.1 MAG: hypothetical protein B7Y42_00680 [Polaromonas sp. 28-63-22]OYZ85278.1 MAG: hypothetical protein B7Y03_00330 [Polaromonas sp. 24-62-144]OZB02420.1 MAG: hypothetical protein B7X59_00495 [Polaromonas sp. 39-63-203]HQS31389.1 tetratricopeptide repeat protein [Polaromonas sp.]